MKARQDFEIGIDKQGERVIGLDKPLSKKLYFKVGDEVPDKYLKDLIQFNREFLDIEYINGKPNVPDELQPKVIPKIIPRKYSQEILTKLINSLGKAKALEELKKILKEEFNETTTSKDPNFIAFTKILTAQERIRRTGK